MHMFSLLSQFAFFCHLDAFIQRGLSGGGSGCFASGRSSGILLKDFTIDQGILRAPTPRTFPQGVNGTPINLLPCLLNLRFGNYLLCIGPQMQVWGVSKSIEGVEGLSDLKRRGSRTQNHDWFRGWPIQGSTLCSQRYGWLPVRPYPIPSPFRRFIFIVFFL